MGLAPLMLLAMIGWAAGPDPGALVDQLSSADESVRTEAAGALEEMGRPALPALYHARGSADRAVRDRVEQLIDLIERQRLLRATKVRLDFDDQPLPAVVEAIEAQTGLPVALQPDDGLRSRRVTLHEAGLLPFWEALDRLGAACGARHNPGVPFSPPPRDSAVRLGAALGPPVPASDAGPFRVYLVHLARHREILPARAPENAHTNVSLSADLQFFAEPGLAVIPTGPAVIQQAVDESGSDLRPDPPIAPTANRRLPARFEEGDTGTWSLTIPLKPPERPGGRLRRFKGFVPIAVIRRTGDPIAVSLGGGSGWSTSKGGVVVSVSNLGRVGDNWSFTLKLRGEQGDPRLAPGLPIPLGGFQPPYRVEDHVELQDDQGRPLWWSAAPIHGLGGANLATGPTAYHVRAQKGAPTRVLYHGVVGARTELAFEFADVPLP